MPFGGHTYDPALDQIRLTGQLGRVLALMRDGQWRTLNEIYRVVGGSEAAISARLRDFRKPKFGGHQVDARRRTQGLWEYRLVLADADIARLDQRIAVGGETWALPSS